MPSGHSIKISTDISRCINAASPSHISANLPYYSWKNVGPIRIRVDVSVANRKMTLCSQLLGLTYIP